MANAIRVTGSKVFLPIIVCLWLAALVPGILYLLAYERTPGKTGEAPPGWPLGVESFGAANLPTLVVVLHPRCSCSSATLTELEEAAARFSHPLNAVMLIYRPRGGKYEWQNASLYRQAQHVLNAKLVLDDDGDMASRFGAFTSGDVLYYSAAGQNKKRSLLFSGGVTGSRGMVGPNAGIQALELAVNASPRGSQNGKSVVSTAVYGCGFSALSSAGPRQTSP